MTTRPSHFALHTALLCDSHVDLSFGGVAIALRSTAMQHYTTHYMCDGASCGLRNEDKKFRQSP